VKTPGSNKHEKIVRVIRFKKEGNHPSDETEQMHIKT